MGGGLTSSGYSASALRNADYWMNRLGTFQKLVVDYAEQIGKIINQVSGLKRQFCDMQIRLLWIDNADKITTYESNSGLIVQSDTKEKWIRVCRAHEVFEKTNI